jgi:hypothetical protein
MHFRKFAKMLVLIIFTNVKERRYLLIACLNNAMVIIYIMMYS